MSEPTEEPTLVRPAITAAPFVVTGRLLDQVPEVGQPFAQAFSVRRIYTGYTGPCMRVRRSSDGVEIDIGFIQTVLDTALLERHCSGFDGFVTVWYDQTGRQRHARQPVWSNQPQIVRNGSILRDNLGNFAIEFNGTYLDTGWEPKEKEVGAAAGMMVVGSAGLGEQGQVGTLEIANIETDTNADSDTDASSSSDTETGSNADPPLPPPVDPETVPEYPNDKVPQGYDTFLLDSHELSETPEERKLVYHGKDKRVYVYDVKANTIESTNVFPPQGPTLVSAELVRAGGEDESDLVARANAPVANVAWGKAIEGKDGKIYGIPMRANAILCIDPSKDDPNEQATLLNIADQRRNDPDKWFTGVYSDATGCIVCPPYNTVDGEMRWLVLDTDDTRSTYQESKLLGQGTGTNLYRSVALDSQERVYAAPFQTSTVARLNLTGLTSYGDIDASRIETRTLPAQDRRGNAGLFSDIVCAGNDRFYMTPWDAGTVLEIEADETMENDARRARGNFGIDLEVDSEGEGYFEPPTVRLGNPELFTDGVSNPNGDFSTLTVGTSLSLTRFAHVVDIQEPGSGFLGPPSLPSTRQNGSWRGANIEFDMGERILEGVFRGYGLDTIRVTNMGNRIGTSNLSLSFFGGKGRDASIRAVRDPTDPQGRILTIEVVDGGTGYFYGPYPGDAETYGIAIEIDPPFADAPSSQRALAEIASWVQVDPNEDAERPPSGWKIEEIVLTQAGENYTRTPNVRLVGDLRGEGISVSIPTAQDHHIQRIQIGDGGDGFRVEPAYSTSDAYWTNNNQVFRVVHPNDTLNLTGGTRAIVRITEIELADGTKVSDPADSRRGSVSEIEIVQSGRGYHPTISPATLTVHPNDYYDGTKSPDVSVTLRTHGRITGIDTIDVSEYPDLGYLYAPTLSEEPGSRRAGSTNSASYVSRLRPPGEPDEPTTQKWIGAAYAETSGGIVTAAPYDAQRLYVIRNTGTGSDGPAFEFLTETDGVTEARVSGSAKYNALALDASERFAFTAPNQSRRVLRYDLEEGNVEFVGPNVRGTYATLVRTSTGVIYGLPSTSLDVLVLDPTNVNDLDELRFGNLNFPGRKFSSALRSQQGLLYAVPDQIPVSLELNPGVPLPRTPSLAPPSIPFRVSMFENQEYHAVVYAPTPEQEVTALQVVVLHAGSEPWAYETVTFPVTPVANRQMPWFGEAVVVENDPNPLVLFTPFYNVNSEYSWDDQNRILIASMDELRARVRTYLETFFTTYESARDGGAIETSAKLQARQTATDAMSPVTYWWSSPIPRDLAPPYPSRTVVAIPRVGDTVIGWVPIGAGGDAETNLETFVTYVAQTSGSDTNPDQLLTSRGNHFGDIGTGNPNAARESERVSWATAGITEPDTEERGGFVTITYEAPSRADDAPAPDLQPNLRNRHTRGVYVNGIVYAAPRGNNDFYRYVVETGDTLRQSWADEFTGLGFQSSNSPRRRGSASGTNRFSDVVYFPQTNEIYAIPENARAFVVWPLDTQERYRFGQFDLEEGTGLSNAQFSMAVVTPNDRIACVPRNHGKIVLIDPMQANFLERLDFSMDMPVPDPAEWTMDLSSGSDWYRYAVTIGDYVYCVPWSARQILRLDPRERTATFVGPVLNGTWGQAVRHPNGRVYCAPVDADGILQFEVHASDDTVTATVVEADLPFSNGRLEGAMLGEDGLVYMTHRSTGRSVVVFDPITTIVSSVGNFRNGIWQERTERHQNLVKVEDGRMFAVPSTLRVFGEIVPNAALIRTYDVRPTLGNFDARRWITEPLFVQRAYRLAPKRIERPRFGADPLPFLVFVNDRGYGVYDMGTPTADVPRPPVLSLSPSFREGLVGLFGDPAEAQDLQTVAYRAPESEDVYERIDARMLDGAIAGIRSESETTELNMRIERNDWVSYVGDGDIRVRGMFNVVFGDRETGVFSIFARGGRTEQVTSPGQLTTFIRGISLGQRTYAWDGNASGGSTFEIGRVFQPVSPTESVGFTGTFAGKLQELVVFQSDQSGRVRTLAENQTFAYNV